MEGTGASEMPVDPMLLNPAQGSLVNQQVTGQEFGPLSNQPPARVRSGTAQKIKLEELVRRGELANGDVWCFSRECKAGETEPAHVVRKEVTVLRRNGKGALDFSMPPGQHRTSSAENGPDLVVRDCTGPSKIALAILEEYGLPYTSRTIDAWKLFSIRRNGQDLGTLWNMREAFWVRREEDDARAQAMGQASRKRRMLSKADEEYTFVDGVLYIKQPDGGLVKAQSHKVSDALKEREALLQAPSNSSAEVYPTPTTAPVPPLAQVPQPHQGPSAETKPYQSRTMKEEADHTEDQTRRTETTPLTPIPTSPAFSLGLQQTPPSRVLSSPSIPSQPQFGVQRGYGPYFLSPPRTNPDGGSYPDPSGL